MSVAAIIEPAAPVAEPLSREQLSSEHRALVSALFAVHRRVVVWMADGTEGPMFCTCGDVWPCRTEERAAGILDLLF